jgi:hypothetical protein
MIPQTYTHHHRQFQSLLSQCYVYDDLSFRNGMGVMIKSIDSSSKSSRIEVVFDDFLTVIEQLEAHSTQSPNWVMKIIITNCHQRGWWRGCLHGWWCGCQLDDDGAANWMMMWLPTWTITIHEKSAHLTEESIPPTRHTKFIQIRNNHMFTFMNNRIINQPKFTPS